MESSLQQTYNWFIKSDFSHYKGQWIAVYGKEVVAHNRSIKKVLQDIKEKHYPKSKTAITKITSKNVIF